ncbi:hypothetical protein HG535_0C05720 [Zygotorulaspora mrakii]|uniref:RNB domain-containing protein n=1 Tax=Zygotorulaspora mrakii TaxID=42260 RepID=A0A7H9B0Q3_ZYGMR|nr:uncharacterized protein HG535_0C05720 [Zygotorulaspora mrakii]QLG72218.1 hypothetical protein HG535_0C05720 [Zygotorulaspora mrakii]
MYRCARGLHCTGALARTKASTGARARIRKSPPQKGRLAEEATALSGSISAHEIGAISSSFVARTRELEPGLEVKQLSQIRAQFQERYDARYLRPSKQWVRQRGIGGTASSRQPNKYLINECAERIHKHDLQFDASALSRGPLRIGDLVLLKQHFNELSMCVDVPSSTLDPRYTFAAVDGTLKFASKSSVLLRMPNNYGNHENEGKLLAREAKHDFAPIGTIKNSPDETIVLSTTARQMVTSYLPQQISKSAWSQLPLVLKNLEQLHRSLQNFAGPVNFPFVKLVQLVQKNMNMHVTAASTLSEILDSAVFLATYWAVRLQQKFHLWGEIQLNRALLTPISVTILPFESQHVYYTNVVKCLKSNNYKDINDFADLVNTKDFVTVVSRFPHIIKLLEDYASGNLENIESIISLISTIFRKIDSFKDNDITKDCCHELLIELTPNNSLWNPMHSNLTLALPPSSNLTKSQQVFFDLVKPPPETALDDFERFDFKDLRVYCIDSDDAHEIDDGISIRELGNGKFTLYIHIADPASLFNESSQQDSYGIEDEVLKIASKKCFTTYLPDLVAPMLPRSYCKAADLGKNDDLTKTITFSVDVVVAPDEQSMKIQNNTSQIRLGQVSRFPQVSYDSVDRTLKETRNLIQDKWSIEQKELKNLHLIARLLRETRVKEMDAVIFGDGFNKGLVKVSDDSQKISFENKVETSSVVLVTEMMILANTLSGKFFFENKIPGVFRSYQPLMLGDRAQNEYGQMKAKIKKGILPSFKDITLLASLLNSSFYSAKPMSHNMIGAPQYLTVTSPLRRFPDLINHLQLHRHIRGLPICFTQSEISNLVDDIQSRDSILKDASRQGATYWTLKFVKDSLKNDPNQRFEVMVTSVPQLGLVRCILPDYPAARGSLKLKPSETKPPEIGNTVANCKITKIDCLDGILELEV